MTHEWEGNEARPDGWAVFTDCVNNKMIKTITIVKPGEEK